jgi:hypothetical protein
MALFQHEVGSAPVVTERVRAEHLEQWRAAARRVDRAWEVWLASDQAERDWAHEVYLEALAREEDAARRLEQDARALDGRPD